MASKGQNVWFDLMTTDPEGAKAFYSEVTGWKTQAWAGADASMPPYSISAASSRPGSSRRPRLTRMAADRRASSSSIPTAIPSSSTST